MWTYKKVDLLSHSGQFVIYPFSKWTKSTLMAPYGSLIVLCMYVTTGWCINTKIIKSYCSTNIEYLLIKYQPHYLPRQFIVFIITAVYMPVSVNANNALAEQHNIISCTQNRHPEGFFIIGWDFNQTNLRKIMPKFHHNIALPTRGENTLDHVYTNTRSAYKAVPHPRLGHSDHISVLLFPTNKPLQKPEKLSTKNIRVWTEEASSALQDCFDCTNWVVFKEASTHNDTLT